MDNKKKVQEVIDKLRDKAIFYKKEEAPEDAIESRLDWDELKDDFDELYYALMEIEGLVSE